MEVDELLYLGKVADLSKMRAAVLARRGNCLAAKTGMVTINGGSVYLHQVYNQVQGHGGLEKVTACLLSLESPRDAGHLLGVVMDFFVALAVLSLRFRCPV